MKAIMISIQPKFVAKILNGEKTIEIRKTMPKDFEGWVYIYCTNDAKEELVEQWEYDYDTMHWYLEKYICLPKCVAKTYEKKHRLNGSVVGRFYLKKVRKYTENDTIRSETIKDTCLTSQEIWEYAKGKPIYFWHIDNLEIFDKPKELSEFYYKRCNFGICHSCSRYDICNNGFEIAITKAPQSWGYIEI